MRKLLTILFLWLVSISLNAATYYVSKTGNNSNTGTMSSPWLTINYGAGRSVAGDTVYVRGGTYNELVKPWGIAGNADNRIVYIAYPGESPIIDGTGLTFTDGSYLVTLYSYMDFEGFEVQNVNANGTNGAGGGCIAVVGSNTSIKNCELHDSWQHGIAIIGYDYNTVENCTIHDCCQNNNRDKGRTAASWGAGITATAGASYCEISHCTVYETWGEGISTYEAEFNTLEDNIIYDVSSAGLYISDATDCIAQRNLIYTTRDVMSGGLMLGYEGHALLARNTIINNIVYGGKRNFYAYCTLDAGTTIANNTFVNAISHWGAGFTADPHSGGNFVNNIIIQEGALPCIFFVEDADVVFSNNLYNKSYDADAVGTGDVVSTTNITRTGAYSSSAYYKILSNSPAVNGGTDVNVDYDFGEFARTVVPDIGAWELENPAVNPIVIITTSVFVGTTTATSGGNVTYDGGGTVTARGVCWGTSVNPTTAGYHTSDGSGSGAFVSLMTPLLPATTYHVRAYATNEAGTGYGSDIEFTTTSDSGLSGDPVIVGGDILFKDGKIVIK